MAELRKPMREPAAAGAEIEDAHRLRSFGQYVSQQVAVVSAANPPLSRMRIRRVDRRQGAVELRCRALVAVAAANEPVLLDDWLEGLPPRGCEKTPDSIDLLKHSS